LENKPITPKSASRFDARVVFLHGRPGPHPFHRILADSVDADLRFVDPVLPWHDRECSSTRRYLSSLLCAAWFPGRGDFDLFLTEGAHAPPVLMRRMGLLRSDQKIVALMDNETLYLVRSGYYPASTRKKILWLVESFDALLCVGAMQVRLARELMRRGARGPIIEEVYSAIPADRRTIAEAVRPSLAGRRILFVGNGPSGFRTWYKGLDLLLDAFERACAGDAGLRLDVVGRWDKDEIARLFRQYPAAARQACFVGETHNLGEALSRASLYVHLGRGEAFGISILEAMAAGVPALVSEWTGGAEVVGCVGPEWIVPLDPAVAAERISAYFKLPLPARERLSAASRAAAAPYTEPRALLRFQQAIGVGPR
jgi:glycosyltransferase involved in cell wall biosynthesis